MRPLGWLGLAGLGWLACPFRVSAGLDEGESSGVTSHRIKGFDRDGVSFGGATAFLAKFLFNEDVHDCAILIPDLTRHEDVVEVIAGVFLRESCSIEDGDKVSISLEEGQIV